MKHILFSLFFLLGISSIYAQGPWKLKLYCSEEDIRLHIDLYEESIEVPGMEMFGPMNGYLGGNIYGVWMITSFKIQDDKTATIKLSNDLGSETQKATLTQQSDSVYALHLDGTVVVKRVVDRKLVKVSSDLKMRLQ
jgi:hypothetical protein